jgi:hypothetical protein
VQALIPEPPFHHQAVSFLSSGFPITSEELDQFTESSYLPQDRRVAAMGRRKIEIKAIKDDRNRSVYVQPHCRVKTCLLTFPQNLPQAQGRLVQEGA